MDKNSLHFSNVTIPEQYASDPMIARLMCVERALKQGTFPGTGWFDVAASHALILELAQARVSELEAQYTRSAT